MTLIYLIGIALTASVVIALLRAAGLVAPLGTPPKPSRRSKRRSTAAVTDDSYGGYPPPNLPFRRKPAISNDDNGDPSAG